MKACQGQNSSLLQKSVNYGRKKFYSTGPRPQLTIARRRREMKKSFLTLAVSGLPQSYLKKKFCETSESEITSKKVEKENKNLGRKQLEHGRQKV